LEAASVEAVSIADDASEWSADGVDDVPESGWAAGQRGGHVMLTVRSVSAESREKVANATG